MPDGQTDGQSDSLGSLTEPKIPTEILFIGEPLIVYISISLRNILDIDELRQVILATALAQYGKVMFSIYQLIALETTMRLYWRDSRLNVSAHSSVESIKKRASRFNERVQSVGV